MENKKSKCMYCNSTNYGTGCPFSPNKIHVHVDDVSKCIYCGSKNFGSGCPFSRNKIHVHGIEYNSMLKDSIQNSIIVGHLISRLSMPLNETPAFKLGIINENYDITRFPITDEEKLAYTPIDAYIFKLKRLLGSKMDIINNDIIFEKLKNEPKNENLLNEQKVKQFENQLKIKDRLKRCLLEIYDIFDDGYQSGLDITTLERILLENFSSL